MRIGLFTDTFPPDLNGVANSTNILFQELKNHGHDVFVVCTRAGTGWAEWNEDHDILRLAGMKFKHLYGYAVTTPWHINALNEVRALNLDVIHVQTEFGVGIFARTCAKNIGIPLVSTYHTDYEDYTHYVNLLKSNRVDDQMKKAVAFFTKLISDQSVEVIAPSKKTKELLECYHVKPEIHIVPTGMRLSQFDPKKQTKKRTHEIRQEFGFSDTDRVVIFVGRIAEEKSLDLVIEGFAKAEKEGSKLKLLIIGKGPDVERLKKVVKEKNIHNVILGGARPADVVADYYRSADLFVSASLSETQGMTFAEAMASGLPLLARRDVVLEDMLIDGETGWYFTDADDLAKKLKKVEALSDEELSRMKERALEVIQPLSSEVFCEKALAVYEKAIETYRSMVVVADVQVKEDVVQVYLSDLKGNNHQEERILMSLDDYFNEGIRKGSVLPAASLDTLRDKQAGVQAWRSIMRRIAVKDRTRKEVYDWLTKNTQCGIETINDLVEKLEKKGYIDDERYCMESVSRMKLALFGRDRMVRELRRKGIPPEMIETVLGEAPDNELENARAYAARAANSIAETSLRMKQRKLKMRLIAKGYSSEIAEEVVRTFEFDTDSRHELENLRQCAQKARKRYERKYEGTKLRNTVYRYCAAQGYQPEDIYVILDEMEWES
ncbi:MAG: RecX family transcriptional regulator [Solobacterium sp.]|nr:RecX family transcriptional regulator [Solobacterium sp.]